MVGERFWGAYAVLSGHREVGDGWRGGVVLKRWGGLGCGGAGGRDFQRELAGGEERFGIRWCGGIQYNEIQIGIKYK